MHRGPPRWHRPRWIRAYRRGRVIVFRCAWCGKLKARADYADML
jgi:hypothetical protein